MSKYRGLFTYDVDNHRYLPIEQADGIITHMDYHPGPEPLIKDEKIRKAVRAWAEANEIDLQDGIRFNSLRHGLTWINTTIEFNKSNALLGLEKEEYTIEELCGEEEE